eukprot:scaffold196669_cov28-Tisochrysis_lutea.AAC.11
MALSSESTWLRIAARSGAASPALARPPKSSSPSRTARLTRLATAWRSRSDLTPQSLRCASAEGPVSGKEKISVGYPLVLQLNERVSRLPPPFSDG